MKRILRRYRRQKCPETQGSPSLVVSKPRQVRKDEVIPQRASVESLPVEIQQIILHQMPDFWTLQALISASPPYLKAYRSQAYSILSDVLRRSIHPDVLFDASAIVDVLKLPRNYDDYVPSLKAFIEQYKITRAVQDAGPEPVGPNAIDKLWDFHLLVIDVTKDFCDYALSTHPVTGESPCHYTSLSPNEMRRVHRAFYRYELFTRLFHTPDIYVEEQRERHRDRAPGRIRLALQRNSTRSLDSQDKSWLLLALFKAWEVEEIACVRDYIMHRYDELYRVYKSEVEKRRGGRSQHDTAPWEQSPELRSEFFGDEACHEYYLSLGLGFFHTIIRVSHEDQMCMLRENSRISFTSLSSTLEDNGLEYGCSVDDAWTSGAPLEFHGDSYKDGPNAAWLWSTGGEAEVCYFQPNKEGLRKWGYVMWDKERLDRWSILQQNFQDYLVEQDVAWV